MRERLETAKDRLTDLNLGIYHEVYKLPPFLCPTRRRQGFKSDTQLNLLTIFRFRREALLNSVKNRVARLFDSLGQFGGINFQAGGVT